MTEPQGLKYNTTHLAFFKDMTLIINLQGKKYELLRKGVWYSLHGETMKDVLIKTGSAIVDSRFNMLIPLKSGHGKNNLKHSMKKILIGMDRTVSEPTSYHHEQFVGKTIVREEKEGKKKNKKYIQNKGHFGNDCILLDEAADLVCSSKPVAEETRQYICTALNTMGLNFVEKRLTDHLPEETLKYSPNCSIFGFFQPMMCVEDIVTKGFTRRFMIPLVEMPPEMNEEMFSKRLKEKVDSKNALDNFLNHLKKVKELRSFWDNGDEWEFTEETLYKIANLHLELLKQGYSSGVKSANYTNIMQWTLQDWLIRMSCIQAASHYTMKVDVHHVELAYMDLVEFWAHTLHFVNQLVKGTLDYAETWQGAKDNDVKALEYLHQHKAYSLEESKVTIAEFDLFLSKIFRVKMGQARNHRTRMQTEKWIESKQVGQHDSRVWLTFKPETQDHKDVKGVNREEIENFSFSAYDEICESLKKQTNTQNQNSNN